MATGAGAAGAVPVITTIAGGPGGPGPANTVSISACGLSPSDGSVTVSAPGVVWQLKSATDLLSPFAGTATGDSKTANGTPALQATVPSPCGTATDANGNVLLADSTTNLLRVVAAKTGTFYGVAMTAGRIYTIAGTGTAGSAGTGGPALKAELDQPSSVAFDGAGNIVLNESSDKSIQVVAGHSGTYYGQKMTADDIYTVFTGDVSSHLQQTAVDPAGNLVMVDNGDGFVYVLAEKPGTFYGQKMTAGTLYPVTTGQNNRLEAVTVDHSGNIVFADDLSHFEVRVVAGTTGTFYGQSMTAGDVYTVANAAGYIAAVTTDVYGNVVYGGTTGVSVLAATSGAFYGQSMTAGKTYLVGGAPSGNPGDGGPGASAQLSGPVDTYVDYWGNVLIAEDYGHALRMLAGKTGLYYGMNVTQGDIYTISSLPGLPNNGIDSVSEDSAGNILIGTIFGIYVLAEHTGTYYNRQMTAGQLYNVTAGYAAVTDSYGNLVSAVVSGTVQVLAAKAGTYYGVSMQAWHSYVVAGGGSGLHNGVPATSTGMYNPTCIRVDASGNLLIADSHHNEIRVVAKAPGTYYGQAMKAGYIYDVAGSPTGAAGFAGNGGPAASAKLDAPVTVVHDKSGNLVIADSGNNQIRVVAIKAGTFYGQAMKAGDIYTIAGSTVAGFWGDGGPATQAALDRPANASVAPSGAVVITDNDRIRSIG